MNPALLSLLPALTLGRADASYLASLRSEVSARTSYAGAIAAADLELSPTIALALNGDATQLSMSYAPSLYLREPYTGATPELLHRAVVHGEWRFRPRERLYANQLGSFGINDFAALAAQSRATEAGTVSVEALPTVGTVSHVRSVSQLGLELWPAPSVLLSLQGGYQISGGADPVSRRLIPLERGPTASLGLRLETDLLNVFSTLGDATRSGFSNGRQIDLGEFREQWQHRYSREVSSDLSGGVGVMRQFDPVSVHTSDTVAPLAEASLRVRFPVRGEHWESRLSGRLGPYLDRFVGLGYQRVEATGEVIYTRGHYRFSARGGGARAVSGPFRGGDAYNLELIARQEVDREWQLEAAFRSGWNRTYVEAAGAVFQWTASVSATYRYGGKL